MKSASVWRMGARRPTGGLLNPHGLDRPLEVFDAGAFGHVLQCHDEVGADGDLRHDPVELVRQRRPGVATVHVDGALERLPSFDRGRHEGQRIGELLLHLLDPLGSAA